MPDWLISLISSVAPSLVGSAGSALLGRHLTGAQREANAFSAAQAQLARDWEEKMYTQYESPKALVEQYREAGLNPALMYGSTVGGSVGTAAGVPSSVSPGTPDILGLMQFALQASMYKEQKRGLELGNEQKEQELIKTTTENEYLVRNLDLALQYGEIRNSELRAAISKISAETDNVLASTLGVLRNNQLIDERITTEQLRHGLDALDRVLKRGQIKQLNLANLKSEWEVAYRNEFGVSPDLPLWTALPTAALSLESKLMNKVKEAAKKLKERGIIGNGTGELLYDEYGNPRFAPRTFPE